MFRTFQTKLDSTGKGSIEVSPFIESMEWDVYQISVQTAVNTVGCVVQISHNGYFLCSSNQGSKDSAEGPPDVVVLSHDILTVSWFNGTPNDIATVGLWFNENLSGTTTSTAH